MLDADCQVSVSMCTDPIELIHKIGYLHNIIFPYTAPCGVPPSPTSGSVEFTNTLEGSIAAFQCNTGLVPEELFAAVCTASGEWAPNPVDLSCSQPASDSQGD